MGSRPQELESEVATERAAWNAVHSLARQLFEASECIAHIGGDTPFDGVITALWVDILRMRGIYPEHASAILDYENTSPISRWKPVGRTPIPQRLRMAIYRRDGFKCVHCGAEDDLTIDHIYPWSRGGTDQPDNLQTLCAACNSRKGDSV